MKTSDPVWQHTSCTVVYTYPHAPSSTGDPHCVSLWKVCTETFSYLWEMTLCQRTRPPCLPDTGQRCSVENLNSHCTKAFWTLEKSSSSSRNKRARMIWALINRRSHRLSGSQNLLCWITTLSLNLTSFTGTTLSLSLSLPLSPPVVLTVFEFALYSQMYSSVRSNLQHEICFELLPLFFVSLSNLKLCEIYGTKIPNWRKYWHPAEA